MLIMGTGFVLGGLVAGSFAPLKMVAVCELIGWALMGVAGLRAEQKERKAAQKLAMYPTYKY